MAKYNFYAVAIGRDPQTKEPVTNKICDNWKECESYIKNVEGARYKGFLTVPEAQEWIRHVLEENTEKKAEKAVSKENKETEPIKKTVTETQFDDVCKELNVAPVALTEILQKMFCQTYAMIKGVVDDDIPFK